MALLLVIGGSRFIGADLSQVPAGKLDGADCAGVAFDPQGHPLGRFFKEHLKMGAR